MNEFNGSMKKGVLKKFFNFVSKEQKGWGMQLKLSKNNNVGERLYESHTTTVTYVDNFIQTLLLIERLKCQNLKQFGG